MRDRPAEPAVAEDGLHGDDGQVVRGWVVATDEKERRGGVMRRCALAGSHRYWQRLLLRQVHALHQACCSVGGLTRRGAETHLSDHRTRLLRRLLATHSGEFSPFPHLSSRPIVVPRDPQHAAALRPTQPLSHRRLDRRAAVSRRRAADAAMRPPHQPNQHHRVLCGGCVRLCELSVDSPGMEALFPRIMPESLFYVPAGVRFLKVTHDHNGPPRHGLLLSALHFATSPCG